MYNEIPICDFFYRASIIEGREVLYSMRENHIELIPTFNALEEAHHCGMRVNDFISTQSGDVAAMKSLEPELV